MIPIDIMLVYLVVSFLIGGIPFGLIVGKIFCDIDIRKSGSGNIGATNVARVLSKKYAALVFLLDGLKSFLVVYIAKKVFDSVDFAACTLFFAVIGHIFSIWLKGKGGKGISSTMLGLMALDFRLSLLMIFIWVITFFITKISAVSALISMLTVVITSFFIFENRFCFFIILLIYCFVIFAHRQNLRRLLDGKELGFDKNIEKVDNGREDKIENIVIKDKTEDEKEDKIEEKEKTREEEENIENK